MDRNGGKEKMVRRNPDKPHRCPLCHKVVTSRAHWWRTYNCRDCNVWWWGWL